MTEPNCIFCRIGAGEIPSHKVLEDGELLAFRDLNPQAPVHVLIIPKRHVVSVSTAGPGDAELLGQLLLAARTIAEREGIAAAGYRIVTNTGSHGGQSVFHLHLHLLGGRPMAWPPG